MTKEQGNGRNSFEDRLREARFRRGMDPKPGADASGAGGKSPLGVGLKVGVELVSALVVAIAIGFALDRWLGTRPIFLGIFLLLGGAAGVLNVWRIYAPPDRLAQKRDKTTSDETET